MTKKESNSMRANRAIDRLKDRPSTGVAGNDGVMEGERTRDFGKRVPDYSEEDRIKRESDQKS